MPTNSDSEKGIFQKIANVGLDIITYFPNLVSKKNLT